MTSRSIPWPRILAEGGAIVVSILLAFGIQAWWEGAQERELELEYVESLIEDLRSDTASIASLLSETRKRAEYGQQVLAVYEAEARPDSPEEFVRAVEYASFFSDPGYTTTTRDDLVSTGNLRLIRAKEVRDALSGYYEEVEWTAQFRDQQRVVQGELGVMTADFLQLEHRYALAEEGSRGQCGTAGYSCLGNARRIPWGPAELLVSESEADDVLERLLARPDARPLYAQMARYQGQHFGNLTSILQLAESALATLDGYAEEGW
jgi:hypothetical protein